MYYKNEVEYNSAKPYSSAKKEGMVVSQEAHCERLSLNEKALYSYNRAGELGYVEGTILKALLLIKGDDNQLADGINTLLTLDPEKDLACGYQHFECEYFPINWEDKTYSFYELRDLFKDSSSENGFCSKYKGIPSSVSADQ